MGTEAEDLNVDQLDDVIGAEESTVAEEDEAAGFLSEFEGEPKPVEAAKEEDDDPEDKGVVAEADGTEGDATGEEAEVNPLEATVAEMQKTIRQIQGKNGELNSRIKDLAKKEATDSGAEAPTKKQLDEAMNDGEKLGVLRDEFPEYFGGIKEAGEIIKADILASLPDNSGISDDVMASIDHKVDMKVLAITHKGWENTVKTPEFQSFVYQDGPTEVELGVYNAVDPERAGEMFDGFIEKYPEWGEKYGRLLASNELSDVTSILDLFEDSKAAPEKVKSSKKDRLKANVAATKSSSVHSPRKTVTEEEAFLAGFNS